MATWHKPRALLLDEHTAALDPKTASLILRLSRDIVQREQLTALMVTHSMQQAVNLGDRLLMMYRGRVLHDFSPSDKRWLKPADLQDLQPPPPSSVDQMRQQEIRRRLLSNRPAAGQHHQRSGLDKRKGTLQRVHLGQDLLHAANL